MGTELTPEENLRLLQELEANRAFILLAYQSNPDLLARAEPEIKRLFEPVGGWLLDSVNTRHPKPA